MAGHPHPKRKLIRRLLVHGICPFEDEIKPPCANLQSELFNEHSFKVFLYNYSAFSKTKREPQRRLEKGAPSLTISTVRLCRLGA